MTNKPTDLRRACEEAAKYLPEPRGISDADVADIIERRLTPVFEAFVAAAAEHRYLPPFGPNKPDANCAGCDWISRENTTDLWEQWVAHLARSDATQELGRIKREIWKEATLNTLDWAAELYCQCEELHGTKCAIHTLRAEVIVEFTQASLSKPAPVNDEQIKYMVDRFLGWRLPENFNPDGGISFKPTFNEGFSFGPMKNEPTGTNLFDMTQAEAMIRYLVDGLPR